VNYLAHAYLSFNHPGILVGNMISDFVKGKKKFDYPAEIQKGIALHRAIDQFTDLHPATKKAKEVFRAHYRLYAGAFIDVVYDHFLASDENEFSEESLFRFSQKVYEVLDLNSKWLPVRFAAMYPFMKKHNWLVHYRTVWGAERSFHGLVRRALYIHESETAEQVFKAHYQRLSAGYRHFWADVKPFAQNKLHELLKTGDNKV
jgi:acyl carrier protein phosphodiesterase